MGGEGTPLSQVLKGMDVLRSTAAANSAVEADMEELSDVLGEWMSSRCPHNEAASEPAGAPERARSG